MNPTTLSALVGFVSALFVIGVPLVGFMYRVDQHAQKSLRLLTGHEEVEADGVLPRLREVEGDVDSIEETLTAADGIEYEQTGDTSTV